MNEYKKGDILKIIWTYGEKPEIYTFEKLERGFLILKDHEGSVVPCRESSLFKIEILEI
tara:strand:- start:200 stop:376 length:177 start_codon:yes stop_codon:yes gene_type:complete